MSECELFTGAGGGELTKGKTVIKYHLIFGFPWKRSTFMPKTPVMKVRGRKINVIHDNLWVGRGLGGGGLIGQD